MTVLSLIDEEGDVLLLDAVTTLSKSRNIAVTKSSVMSGAEVGDGIRVGNFTASFSGVCTTSKIRRRGPTEVLPPTPRELDVLLQKMVDSQKRFTLYGNHLIETIRDVVITNHVVTQEAYLDSVIVAISVEQVFVSEVARQATFTLPAKEAADQIPKKEEKGAGTKAESPDWREVYRSPSLQYFQLKADLAGGLS